MLRNLPNVTYHTIEKLFWNKFAFCVEYELPKFKYDGYDNYYQFRQMQNQVQQKKDRIIGQLMDLCPDKSVSAWRKVDQYYTVKFYFADKEVADKLILDSLSYEELVIVSIEQPRDEAHIELLKNDFKIVTRPTLFGEKFTWKITYKGISKADKDAIDDWVLGFFDEEEHGTRFAYDVRNKTGVLYLRDEDDVMITKLSHSQFIRKIEKAVVLNNNNNKESTQDETRTVPHTS